MSPKILICDDEEISRENIKYTLTDNYDLVITKDGEQCLDCLTKMRDIGLILIDINLPKVNGLGIIEEITTKYPKIPVIILTGHKSVTNATKAVRLGASGYIIKPLKSEELIATVRSKF